MMAQGVRPMRSKVMRKTSCTRYNAGVRLAARMREGHEGVGSRAACVYACVHGVNIVEELIRSDGLQI